jgi:hypothetical protein
VTGLEGRLRSVFSRIAAAAERNGREPEQVRLVAVTKTQPMRQIAAAYDLGLREFGENRLEEATGKIGLLPPDIAWHMIGHVQSRKAKPVASLFCLIHSLDSLRLALRLNGIASHRPEPLPVLLEINVSGERSKFGFAAANWSQDPLQ